MATKYCLLNVGKWKKLAAIRSFLTKLNINFSGLQKNPSQHFGFITFDTTEDKVAAEACFRLPQHVFFGKLLELGEAKAKTSESIVITSGMKREASEPLQSPRQDDNTAEAGTSGSKQPKLASSDPTQEMNLSTPVPAVKSVIDVVTPWYNLYNYPNQLARKHAAMQKVLIKLTRSVRKDFLKKYKPPKASLLSTSNPPIMHPLPSWLDGAGYLVSLGPDQTLYMKKPNAPWESLDNTLLPLSSSSSSTAALAMGPMLSFGGHLVGVSSTTHLLYRYSMADRCLETSWGGNDGAA